VKRVDLLRMIAVAARDRAMRWELIRQGAAHEIWSIDGREFSVPRHREIRERTARAILRALEEEFGQRWWER
jgi:hypothetical protein